MSRLQQFNEKKRSEMNAEEHELDSQPFHSTQDSLFLQAERSTGMTRHHQVYSQSMPRRQSQSR